MPIYYAIYTFISEPETYWWPLNREVRSHVASALLWANLIGYALPTALMFTPWESPYTVQNFESLWQISPMLVPIICNVVARIFEKGSSKADDQKKADKVFPDLAPLKTLYLVVGALGFLHHVYCLSKISSSPDISFASVFWPDFSPTAKTFGEGLRAIFLADFYGFFIATFGWLCMAVYDLKRMGRTRVELGQASALILAGQFTIGPGATMALVWYWRETNMSKTIFATGGVN